jgi:hypothetical protein
MKNFGALVCVKKFHFFLFLKNCNNKNYFFFTCNVFSFACEYYDDNYL